MAQLVTAITPSVGGWIIIKKFSKEVEAVLYDPTSTDPEKNDPDSLRIIGWPYGQATPVLTFTELISGKDYATADGEKVSERGPDAGKKKYISIESIFGTDLMIGTRQERVWVIKQLEMHPAIVKASSKEKVNLRMILQITVRVDDPIKALRIDFLGFAAKLIVEAFRRWCSKNEYNDIMQVNTTDNPHVTNEVCDYIEGVNVSDFAPNGFQVPHVAVIEVAVAEDSVAFPESERKIGIEANNLKTKGFTKEIELLENSVQEKRNATKLKLLRGELDAKAKYIEKTSVGIANQNKAWGGQVRTVVINDPNRSNQIQTIEVANAN